MLKSGRLGLDLPTGVMKVGQQSPLSQSALTDVREILNEPLSPVQIWRALALTIQRDRTHRSLHQPSIPLSTALQN